jgi:hypothetical protein
MSRSLRFVAACACLAFTLGVTAAEPRAKPAASAANAAPATTWADLTAAEHERIEKLIAREVAAARSGGVRAFRDTFTLRRSPAELTATGLDRLSPIELDALNARVAHRLAANPAATDPLAAHRTATRAADAPTEGFALPRLPLEVSGSVTAVYGTSKRGDFYGGGISMTVFDPNHGWAATIAVSTLRGAVPYSRYGYRSGYGYHGGPACW